MSYSVPNIRNVCLLGHSGNGKTALAESLLYMTGAIDRMGRGADGMLQHTGSWGSPPFLSASCVPPACSNSPSIQS